MFTKTFSRKHLPQLLVLPCALSLASPNALAEDDKPRAWSGSGEAGYNQKSGNVKSDSLLARLKLKYAQAQTDYKSLLEIENKTQNDQKITERYVLDLQADRYFSKDKSYYAFFNGRGEQDKVVGTEQDLSLTIGIGKILYKTEMTELSAEVGAGYQTVKLVNETADSQNFEQATGRGKLDLNHKFNDIISFAQDALYFFGEDQYKIETNTGLRAALNSDFSVSTSYKYRYNSNPAADAKKTDGETNLTLIYTF